MLSNTNQFTVQSVDFSPIRLRMDAKMHFPVLSLRTNYQNIVGRSFNCQVFGNGNADGDLYSKKNKRRFPFQWNAVKCAGWKNRSFLKIHSDLNADVRVELAISVFGKLSISKITTSTNMGSARINVNSFVSNSDACNAEFSRTLPRTMQNNQPFINKLVSDLVTPLANRVLNTMSLSDLLDLINANTPGPFPPCNGFWPGCSVGIK